MEILNLAIDSQQIDIVFDIYLRNSIEASARKSREKSIEPVPVSINRDDQQLPSAKIASGHQNRTKKLCKCTI